MRRSGSIHTPLPSGPRCSIASRRRTRYSAVTVNGDSRKLIAPTMPHMLSVLGLAAPEQEILDMQRQRSRLHEIRERNRRHATPEGGRQRGNLGRVPLVRVAALPEDRRVARAHELLEIVDDVRLAVAEDLDALLRERFRS